MWKKPSCSGNILTWASVVGTVTRLRTGWSGVRIPVGEKNFLFSGMSGPIMGSTKSPIQWVLGLFPGFKATGAWICLFIEWSYNCTSPICPPCVNRDKFTLFFHGATTSSKPGPPHCRGFTITLRHTTFGMSTLDGWSARRRDPYLTKHNTHKWQTPMTPAGFEPAIPASERRKTARPMGSPLPLPFTNHSSCCMYYLLQYKENLLSERSMYLCLFIDSRILIISLTALKLRTL